MAVAFDAVASSTGTSATTPSTTPWLTWTHTAGTGGGTVIVGLAWGSTSFPPTITSITYGGNAMTLLGSIATNNTSTNGGVLLYGITGQASGANTVLVKTSADPTNVMIGNSVSFTGAASFGTAVTAFGNGASASVTVNGTASGNVVAGVEAHGTNTAVSYTSGTQRFDDEVSAATGASNLSGATIAAGGSVTLTDTIATDAWGAVAVEVQAAADGSPAVPQQARSRFRQRRSPRQLARQMPWALSMDAAGAISGPPIYPLGHPVQARQLPQRGGSTARRAGVYAQLGPPARPPERPVQAQPAVPFLVGRARRLAGAYGGTGPPVRPPRGPVASAARGLPPAGRVSRRAGAYGNLGPPVTPPRGPVTIHRAPPPAGHAASRAGPLGVLGPAVRQPRGPVRIVPAPPPRGRSQSRAGTFTSTVIVSGPPVYPLGHPVRTRPQPPPGGRVVKAAGTYAGTGPPAVPQQQPVSAARRPVPPRGRIAALRGPYSGTGPPARRWSDPARGQPAKPLLTGRTSSRAGTFTAPVVAPGGTVTLTDAATATVTVADQLAQTVTLTDAATASVTVGDFQP